MKFFQKQKVDQIGVTSVSLQKILVVLILLSAFSLFNGGLFSLILCVIGFIGAYKRHTGFLRAYFSISVALIIVAFVFALISSFTALNSVDYEEYSSSSSSDSSNSHTHFAKSFVSKLVERSPQPPLPRGTYPPTGTPYATPSATAIPTRSASPATSFPTPAPTQPPTYSWSSTSDYDDDFTAFVFIAILVMILAFIVVYLKVYSLVLAFRLRKMILLQATSLPTDSQTHEFAATNTSCAVPTENEAPAVPQAPVMPYQFTPGFSPYPYPYPMMPMSPSMHAGQVPPHVMFGQQPVFYTYAPAPQAPAPTNPDEKL